MIIFFQSFPGEMLLDKSGLFADSFKNYETINYTNLENISLNEAKLATETSEVYGLLYIPKARVLDDFSESVIFYSDESPSISMMRSIENEIENRVNVLKLEEFGIDAKQIKELRINIDAKIETFEGKKTSKLGTGLKLIFGGIAGYLLFMFILIYGNMIMRSVIEEKTSRIIEIIISSVKPIKLLLGKIFGTTLAGVTQFAVWIVIILLLNTAISSIFGIVKARNLYF